MVLHLRAQGLEEGDEHLSVLWSMVDFTFTFNALMAVSMKSMGPSQVYNKSSMPTQPGRPSLGRCSE